MHSVIKHTRDRSGASRQISKAPTRRSSTSRSASDTELTGVRWLQALGTVLILGCLPLMPASAETPERPTAQLQERTVDAQEQASESQQSSAAIEAAATAVAAQALAQAELVQTEGIDSHTQAEFTQTGVDDAQAEFAQSELADAQGETNSPRAAASAAVQSLETEELLASLKDEADPAVLRKKLEMLARKVGELQARLLQLDLLGEQLADMAGIPAEDYRVDPPAAQGGPMIEAEPISYRQLEGEVLSLEQRLAMREDHLTVLDARLTDLVAHLELTPSRMPIEGYRYRSSSFGPRFDPINGRRAFHEGLDFAAPRGTPILAAAGGVVVTARYLRGFGNTVEIDHGDQLLTRYAHAAKLLVKPGQVVQRGQKIATVGSTGRSTGAHLHFEVRLDGKALDPRIYLAGSGEPMLQALAARP